MKALEFYRQYDQMTYRLAHEWLLDHMERHYSILDMEDPFTAAILWNVLVYLGCKSRGHEYWSPTSRMWGGQREVP